MARYIVRKSYIDVIGGIWWPMGATCAMHKDLSNYDVENIRAYGEGVIDRDSVEHWLMLNSGDFSSVQDFRASIEDGDQTIDLDWAEGEESDCTFSDCMWPAED
jgi:hypothetical protein